jgi:ribosomal protein S14
MISKLQTSKKEKKLRHQYRITEPTRRYYKFLKLQSRILGFMPLVKLPKVHFKNYCLVTGSGHSVYSKRFRLSRHQVKRYFGYITGLTVASW